MAGAGEHRASICLGARNVSPSQILLVCSLIAPKTAASSGHRRTLGAQCPPCYDELRLTASESRGVLKISLASVQSFAEALTFQE